MERVARTQMHSARRGEITDAMRFVAEREQLAPETVRDEIAIGRLIIPANIHHLAGALEPMELAHLPYKQGKTYEDYVGLRGLKRFGKKKWRRYVADVVVRLKDALEAEYVVLGGGNAKRIKELPPDTRLGDNRDAFAGGVRLWGPKIKRQPVRS